MSWLASVFGGTAVIDTALDGVYNGVDKLIYTEEEKADFLVKRMDQHTTMLKAYEPFKLIQRGLAIAVTCMFAFILIVQVVLVVLSIWFSDILVTLEVLNSLEVVSTIGYSFLAIMSLYFTGGVVNSFKSK